MARLAYGQGNSQVTTTKAILQLLERTGPHLAYEKACDAKDVPMKTSEQATWQRAVNGIVSTTTVTEGVTPASRALTFERVSATLGEYVEIYESTTRQKELGEYDVIEASKDVLTDLVLNTREAVSHNTFRAGTAVLYNSSAISSRATVNGVITLGRLQKASRQLSNNKAWKFTEVDRGGAREGTVPLEASYIVFCHTDLIPDLRNLAGLTVVAEYGSRQQICPYEFGSTQDMTFVCTPQMDPFPDAGAATSTLISTSGTSADVYPVLVVGKHALGCVRLRGSGKHGMGNVALEVLDGADKSDPGNQRCYVACRWHDAKVILNDNWLRRIEVGATDNP